MSYPTTHRRKFLQSAGLAGIGAGVLAGDAAVKLLGGLELALPLGTPVVDVEDPMPDRAIVIRSPDVSIREWQVFGTTTVADHNPAYDPDEQVVIVAFEEQLFAGWERLAPGSLFEAVCDQGIKFYAFPASRLERV